MQLHGWIYLPLAIAGVVVGTVRHGMTTPDGDETEPDLRVDASLAGGELVVEGTVDLPDGTILFVVIASSMLQEPMEFPVPVKDGAYRATFAGLVPPMLDAAVRVRFDPTFKQGGAQQPEAARGRKAVTVDASHIDAADSGLSLGFMNTEDDSRLPKLEARAEVVGNQIVVEGTTQLPSRAELIVTPFGSDWTGEPHHPSVRDHAFSTSFGKQLLPGYPPFVEVHDLPPDTMIRITFDPDIAYWEDEQVLEARRMLPGVIEIPIKR